MEVEAGTTTVHDPRTIRESGESIFEADPASFSRWLSGNRSDSLRNRWRADSAHSVRRTRASSSEVSQSPDGDESGIDKSNGIFSAFGHCAPLPAGAPLSEGDALSAGGDLSEQTTVAGGGDWKNEDIRCERLVRLLAAQQAWYDAKEAAAQEASAFLNILEHHQTQWLQANSPEKHNL